MNIFLFFICKKAFGDPNINQLNRIQLYRQRVPLLQVWNDFSFNFLYMNNITYKYQPLIYLVLSHTHWIMFLCIWEIFSLDMPPLNFKWKLAWDCFPVFLAQNCIENIIFVLSFKKKQLLNNTIHQSELTATLKHTWYMRRERNFCLGKKEM